ncbi:MAG: hypothetical protein WC279_10420 [Sulfurimonas sp.]|uniref:hypothetical protein n=1 Tax=Sulfurimonas sp. TaxID=2022749 RepID=UPI0035686746
MTLILRETHIDSPAYASIRWSCDIRNVLYFKVYRGLNPAERTEIAQTQNVALGSIPVTTPALNGTVYMYIEALDANHSVVDTLAFRITQSDVHNYNKFRKWFEYNFQKASLKSAAGIQLALLQRKYTGTPCSRCASPVTGEPEDPRCSVCFGTGFEGGYYTPLIINGLRGACSETAITQNAQSPVKRIIQSFILPPYPVLQAGDHIIDTESYAMYELIDNGRQTMEMDMQRLGSTMYQAEMLTKNHPLSAYPVQLSITGVTGVVIGDGEITVTGTQLPPLYGILYISVNNLEHDDPLTVDEDIYYYDSLLSIKPGELRFRASSRFYGKHCSYRFVVNNRYFEGELNA